jgi:hypothetical protein
MPMFPEFITGSPYESLRKSGTSIRKKKKKKNPALLTPSTASAARLGVLSLKFRNALGDSLISPESCRDHAPIRPQVHSHRTGAIFSSNSSQRRWYWHAVNVRTPRAFEQHGQHYLCPLSCSKSSIIQWSSEEKSSIIVLPGPWIYLDMVVCFLESMDL